MTMTMPMRMVDRFETLTERERIVLTHMQDGLSACEIARAEYCTVSTVRTHIRGVLTKLGVTSQLAAVAKANRRRCSHCQMAVTS